MWLIYVIGGCIIVYLIVEIIENMWFAPGIKKQYDEKIKEIQALHYEEINRLKTLHNEEIRALKMRLDNSDDLHVISGEFGDIVLKMSINELNIIFDERYQCLGTEKIHDDYHNNSYNKISTIKHRINDAIVDQYKYQYLIYLFPELNTCFNNTKILRAKFSPPIDDKHRIDSIINVVDYLKSVPNETATELIRLNNRILFLESTQSNLTAIPYMARIMADYETYGFERLALELDWGKSIERKKKVKSIREIKEDARIIVEKYKNSEYQLHYLIRMFPQIEDFLEIDYAQLPHVEINDITETDSVRNYLSREEYLQLSVSERNQLALDRYKKSHARSKWQIGRDYELFIGYKYSIKGYNIDYFGSYMGLEDLGRDIIAKKDGSTLIIQCKYWSTKKQIHENHINQLFGTTVCYCFENKLQLKSVKGILITNTQLSPKAKEIASFLGIEYKENYEIGEYPCIKCNIGRDINGNTTRIYHLPFDQQYDSTKITNEGECFAMTVKEAESKGFRRANKWLGSNNPQQTII